ncbi:MAG: ABC transporter ATP-binding protein [Deltaproteobacteria bacterium]|nr:ABC transporter ATP-binding protein [Deltaproteobacteria bacterium]
MKPTDLIKPYFSENRRLIAAGIVSLIIVDVLQLFIPRVIKWAIDDLTAMRIEPAELLDYALQIVGIAVLIGIFRFIWRHCLLGTSRRVEEGLRNELLAHVQTLSPSYFDRTKTGDLMAHATNDIQQVRMATGMGLVAINDALVLGVASIGFMAYINLRLTLLVLIPMPLLVFGTRFFSRKMHRRYQTVQAAFADLTEAVRERFAGIRVIKSYALEDHEAARVSDISRGYLKENIDLVKITGAFFPMMGFLTNLSLAIVIFVGGRQTITQTITPGDFVAFISYLGLLTWPMMALGWVTNLIQRGKASLDRLTRILTTRPEILDAPGAKAIIRSRGAVRLENVRFAYGSAGGNSQPALTGIDLDISPGSILGIVGPPGSGKTTLLNLIPRLYDVSGGRILLDGEDIRSLKLRDLRTQMAFVPQEPFLFAGSIRQNITFGRPDLDDRALMAAADQAAVHDTITAFPNGYDTIVGERGIILSGGQKQRIALARALLHAAPILALDDPISQVDQDTGNRMVATIRSMAGDRTILIASHRLSAIRFADTIIALENGRIAERGTHRELMESNRYYARTYRLQEIEEDRHAN